MKIGIGIDTGGTCTDAVAYDFDTETLLAKGKSLTTRENLSVGIGKALDMLPPEMVRDAVLISLSTTLATNACVENKGARAKLLIFGLTDELIVRFDAQKKYGFTRGSVRCIEASGSADGLSVNEPDWEALFKELRPWLSDADALAIAELYSMANGAPCEKHAKQLISERLGLACVGASELSGELDVLARGATALLNARLFPVGREFIEAAFFDFERRGCKAPVMVVRSDGSLMSAQLTRSRPVETILSGPAASVLAGKSFAPRESDSLIIDMGGTTTDVSVISGGRPAMAKDGINIGGWRTHVKGVFVDTFALGGDSAVRVFGDYARLNARRVMPVCAAAERWAEIKPMLSELLESKRVNQFPLHEFFYLVREVEDFTRYDDYELKLIDALKSGPCSLARLSERAKIDLYHLDSERLEAEGVIMRCGLTPTDFMHISGDYTEFDTEASELAARYMLLCLNREDTDEQLKNLTGEVYGIVGERLYENLVRILLTREYPAKFSAGLDAQTEFLIRDAWSKRETGCGVFMNQLFKTKAALIGVGAPTHVFLPQVAGALGTQCILPEHAEVANAIGALKADIHASYRVEISQVLSTAEGLHYITHAPDGGHKFKTIEEAEALAKTAAEEAAIAEARARGAMGRVSVNTYIQKHTTLSNWGTNVSMGSTAVSEVTARFF